MFEVIPSFKVTVVLPEDEIEMHVSEPDLETIFRVLLFNRATEFRIKKEEL